MYFNKVNGIPTWKKLGPVQTKFEERKKAIKINELSHFSEIGGGGYFLKLI